MTAPRRQPGWPRRLGDLVQRRLSEPFKWGTNDCASFVADAVMALHCADTLAPLRVPRHTARQAVRQTRAAGGTAVLERCGLQPELPSQAMVGDVVLLQQGRHRLLALCNGADALAPGRLGLECLPMAHALAAWRA
jgi:hypothetical protein